MALLSASATHAYLQIYSAPAARVARPCGVHSDVQPTADSAYGPRVRILAGHRWRVLHPGQPQALHWYASMRRFLVLVSFSLWCKPHPEPVNDDASKPICSHCCSRHTAPLPPLPHFRSARVRRLPIRRRHDAAAPIRFWQSSVKQTESTLRSPPSARLDSSVRCASRGCSAITRPERTPESASADFCFFSLDTLVFFDNSIGPRCEKWYIACARRKGAIVRVISLAGATREDPYGALCTWSCAHVHVVNLVSLL